MYHPKATQTPADPASNTQSSTSSSSNVNQAQQPNFEICEFTFVDFDQIKQPKTIDDINAKKDRTIQVLDIPLKNSTASVRTAFSKYGDIQKLTLRTKGPFQQAFITYLRKDSIAPFHTNHWSVYMMRQALRIIPITLSEEARALRRNFALKLSGLPRNTLSRDLEAIVSEVGAKSCVINRNPNNYLPVNYAYLNFPSTDALATAINKNCTLKGCPLFWTLPKSCTCNKCGSPEHITRMCNSPIYKRKDPKWEKHYNQFKLAQHRKPHRSYATAARSNNTSDPQRQHTLDNVQKALLTVMNELKNMKVDMAEIKQDINTRKSSQRSRSNHINITQNRNSNINVNNKGPVTNTASQARERFDRTLTDKGMNPKKRVRVIDSSAS